MLRSMGPGTRWVMEFGGGWIPMTLHKHFFVSLSGLYIGWGWGSAVLELQTLGCMHIYSCGHTVFLHQQLLRHVLLKAKEAKSHKHI